MRESAVLSPMPLHVWHPWKGWGVTLGIVLFFAILGRH